MIDTIYASFTKEQLTKIEELTRTHKSILPALVWLRNHDKFCSPLDVEYAATFSLGLSEPEEFEYFINYEAEDNEALQYLKDMVVAGCGEEWIYGSLAQRWSKDKINELLCKYDILTLVGEEEKVHGNSKLSIKQEFEVANLWYKWKNKFNKRPTKKYIMKYIKTTFGKTICLNTLNKILDNHAEPNFKS